MRNRDPIVVGRTNPREDLRTVLKEGQNRLNDNISVIILKVKTDKQQKNGVLGLISNCFYSLKKLFK